MADRKDTTSNSKKRRATATSPVDEEFEITPKKNRQEVYEESMTLALASHGYSLAFFQQGVYYETHSYLKEGFKQVSAKASKAHLLKLYNREKDKLKQAFESVPSRICLTCDILTDLSGMEYLCLSAHYVDRSWKLQSKLLNLVSCSSSCEKFALSFKVDALLFEWGIYKKILTVTLDKGKVNHALQGKLRDLLNCFDGALLSKGEFLYVQSGAPFLDLIAQEAFKAIDDPIRKIREGVKIVVESKEANDKFRNQASTARLDCSKGLLLDCPSRWNSTYCMLELALKARYCFDSVMHQDQFRAWSLTYEELSRIQRICKLLKPLHDMMNLYKGTEYPSANMYFINIWKIGLCLLGLVEDEDPEIRNMAQRMKTKFEEYLECYNDMLALAIVFDPRYKLRFVKFCYRSLDEASAEDRCAKIRDRLDKLFQEYIKRSMPSVFKQAHPEFVKWEREEGLYSFKLQLDVYLTEFRLDCQDNEFDVLSWWKQNQHRFPVLSLMAIDILSIPITTFSSDSVFNLGNRLLHKWRSSLLPEDAEALIATRNWIFGYRVDPEEVREFMGVEMPLMPKPKMDEDAC